MSYVETCYPRIVKLILLGSDAPTDYDTSISFTVVAKPMLLT